MVFACWLLKVGEKHGKGTLTDARGRTYTEVYERGVRKSITPMLTTSKKTPATVIDFGGLFGKPTTPFDRNAGGKVGEDKRRATSTNANPSTATSERTATHSGAKNTVGRDTNGRKSADQSSSSLSSTVNDKKQPTSRKQSSNSNHDRANDKVRKSLRSDGVSGAKAPNKVDMSVRNGRTLRVHEEQDGVHRTTEKKKSPSRRTPFI